MSKEYISISGNTGKDPSSFDTRVGEAVKFSLAQRKGYGDGPEDTRWYAVTVFNEGLRDRVKRELPKGSRCVVEGFAEEREYNGNKEWQIVADRIGIVEWFAPTKREKAAAAPVKSDRSAAPGEYDEDV